MTCTLVQDYFRISQPQRDREDHNVLLLYEDYPLHHLFILFHSFASKTRTWGCGVFIKMS